MTKAENSKWIVILMKIMPFKTMMMENYKMTIMMGFYKTETMTKMNNFKTKTKNFKTKTKTKIGVFHYFNYNRG